MSIGSVPEIVYAFESRVEDLRRISRASGYFTEVATVKTPGFHEDRHDLMVVDAMPSLFVWPWRITRSSEGDGPAERMRGLEILVQGYFKESSDTTFHRAGLLLQEDVDHAMLSNPQANFPGSSATPNVWGVTTEFSQPLVFDFVPNVEGIGFFRATWAVTFRTPR